jgi:hypothetical protein
MAAEQVCSDADLAFRHKGSRATSRVAQASPREARRTRRFMRYRIEVPRSESGRGREPRSAAEESRGSSGGVVLKQCDSYGADGSAVRAAW